MGYIELKLGECGVIDASRAMLAILLVYVYPTYELPKSPSVVLLGL